MARGNNEQLTSRHMANRTTIPPKNRIAPRWSLQKGTGTMNRFVHMAQAAIRVQEPRAPENRDQSAYGCGYAAQPITGYHAEPLARDGTALGVGLTQTNFPVFAPDSPPNYLRVPPDDLHHKTIDTVRTQTPAMTVGHYQPAPTPPDSAYLEPRLLPPPKVPPPQPDVEEGIRRYRPGGFHPVRLYDVYESRYQALRKLGHGQYSTVWLVRDLCHQPSWDYHRFYPRRYYALKVVSAECRESLHERAVLGHLRAADDTHPGYDHVCHLVDDFEHRGPNGIHLCLVFELMGETLGSFGSAWYGGRIETEVMKKVTGQLLWALKFVHDSGVIHTDIKPDNIFVKMQVSPLVIDTILLTETPAEVVTHSEPYRTISSVHLGRIYHARRHGLANPTVVLGDFGLATFARNDLRASIQPVALRAPEVLLGLSWSYGVDLWNLAVIVFEVYRDRRLFHPYRPDPDGAICFGGARWTHSVRRHLYQIQELCGQFPSGMLNSMEPRRAGAWFRSDCRVRLEHDRELGDVPPLWDDFWVGGLEVSERWDFVDWMLRALTPDPAKRPSVEDLLVHKWMR